MTVAVFAAVVVAATAVVVLLGVVAGRRLADRWHRGTGREQWLQTARELSWRQRWTIAWAHTLGRPVRDPRLVKAAEVRARYGIAAGERMQQPGSPMGRSRWVMIPLAILVVLLGVLNVSSGLRSGWLNVATGSIMAATWIWMPRMLASGRKRIQRSLDSSPRTPSGSA